MYNGTDLFKKYIAAKEIIAKIEPQIRKMTKDKKAKRIGLGLVGYKNKERKKVLPTAQKTLLQKWQEQEGTLEQLFNSMELSVRAIEKIARLITNNKSEREALIEKLTRNEPYSSFGVHKDKNK